MANGLFNLKQVVQAVQQGGWPAQKPPAVEYLVVAGGGGGSGYAPGGGGGLLTGVDLVPNGQTLLVTVGAGGAVSNNGANSVFGSVTSVGGGRPAVPAVVGGSGGGGPNGPTTNAIGLPGQGTVGQGNTGGYGRDTGASYYGGGGGGSGTTGYAANNGICGTGGAGIASAISGTVTAYAGGGGGGHAYGGSPGAGGVGGGGAGGDAVNPTPANGYPGTANTGGGGGAASYNGVGANAAAGGSGIVIVSYPDVYAAAASTTGSPTVSTSGSGSYSNNGSQNYLNYGNQSALHLGSGSFTVEMWLYKNANTPVMTACGDLLTGSTNTFCIMGDSSTGTKITWYEGSSGGFLLTSTTSLATSTWYHVAFVRNGSTITLYINGVSEAVATLTTNYNATTSFFVGQTPEAISGRAWNGNISNFRVVKGTAVYTSNFTPSTTPLTAITNTSLLLNTVSGAPFADGSGNGFGPTAVGTPAWNALSPFTVTGYKNRVYTWTSSGSITF